MKKLLLCLALCSSMTVFSDLSQKDELLFQAIKLRDFEAVKEALANGADVNIINDLGGDRPLQTAEREDYAEIVELLIDNGARIDVLGKYTNETILHSAVNNKHIEIVELLLARGADVNIQDMYLNTPLHRAATFESNKIAQLLIENGADVNAENKFGQTALYKAIECSYFQPIRSVKLVELFLDNGVDVNAIICDKKKLTPLLWAVIQRQKEIVKLLLKRGADRKAIDIDGNTAFYWAKYDPEIAKLL